MSTPPPITDIPTKTDLAAHLMYNQNVQLLLSDDANALGADNDLDRNLLTMKDISYDKDHPETREEFGTMAVFGHGAPNMTIQFTVSVAEDIFGAFQARSTRNAAGAIPIYKYGFRATSEGGDSKTIVIDGKMFRVRYSKPDGNQGGHPRATCTIRVLNDAEPAAV